MGQKPQYNALRVFGNVGYAHVPPELHKKLDVKATRGHVVAHLGASKGWLLWFPETGKFIASAMVHFPKELLVCHVNLQAFHRLHHELDETWRFKPRN
ncbi:uncharacterized protein VP01_355g2 [Puccinia sorghi]|uniref:Retroviral polymerase SH3-like domain-containing protein n=1 Tax=Puccinia sorghi TaxID=27349 RepID=A0A0L6UVC5_9BASI|nr:uncharacterized protein VP01_355g2 [Puccinia sorghi]